MSTKPTTSTGPRTVRRTVITRGQTAKKGTRKPQSSLNSSSYRLSKPTQYKNPADIQNGPVEPYSSRYFKEHPEEDDDIRTPYEKLSEFDDMLSGDLENDQLYGILVKQKILRTIEFGEISAEVAKSHVALGNFYQNTNRPKSAIRHYDKAHEIESVVPLDQEISSQIAVGTAESHMSIQDNTPKKHVNQASRALEPALEADIIDPDLHLRRDIIRARIARAKGSENALELYQTAEKTLSETPTDTENAAEFYIEFAELLEENKQPKERSEKAKKAYDIYEKLELHEKAEEIKPMTEYEEPPEASEKSSINGNTQDKFEEDENGSSSDEEDEKKEEGEQKKEEEDKVETGSIDSKSEKRVKLLTPGEVIKNTLLDDIDGK